MSMCPRKSVVYPMPGSLVEVSLLRQRHVIGCGELGHLARLWMTRCTEARRHPHSCHGHRRHLGAIRPPRHPGPDGRPGPLTHLVRRDDVAGADSPTSRRATNPGRTSTAAIGTGSGMESRTVGLVVRGSLAPRASATQRVLGL